MPNTRLPDDAAPLRLVALGDSNAEGQHDPAPDGSGFRGWTDRLAGHLAATRQGEVRYANLAVGGQTAAQVRQTQLARALGMRPHLAPVVAGVNDMLRPRFDAARLTRDLDVLHGNLAAAGALVLCFTMPDMARVAPLAVLLRPRLRALNTATREVAARHGSLLVDLAEEPVSSDPALWHTDRLHANAQGHRRIAEAMAAALGQPMGRDDWRRPPDGAGAGGGAARPGSVRGQLAREAGWLGTQLLPWLLGHGLARLLGPRAEEPPAVGKLPELAEAPPVPGDQLPGGS